MVRLNCIFVLMTMLYFLINVSQQRVNAVYIPSYPRTCRQFCENLDESVSFMKEYHCRQIHVNDSICKGHLSSESALICLVKMKTKKTHSEWAEITGRDTCYTDSMESTSMDVLESLQYKPNISLHQACEKGKLRIVKYILKNRMEGINSRNKIGKTPVMVAARHGQVTVVDYLVSQECDLSAVDDYNNNVLHDACMGGNTYCVRIILMRKKNDIESRGWKKWTPVIFAVYDGHREVLDLLVRKGCNLTAVTERKENILHVACMGGHVDMVKHILSQDIVSRDSKKRFQKTAVMLAAELGYVNIVDLLVNEGCNPKEVDAKHNNILHLAIIGGHVDMVKYILIKDLVGIESRGYHEGTPVLLASKCGQREVVELLKGNGCNLKATDFHKNNVLHCACISGHVDMVKYILENDVASIESRGYSGRTSVLMAARYGHKKVYDLLVSEGCSLTVLDASKNCILHLACYGGHIDMVNYILSKNMSGMETKGIFGRTPVMIAAESGHGTLVNVLVRKGCNLKALDMYENNMLHMACIGGDVDIVKNIISNKIFGTDSKGFIGRTPVMIAAKNGHRRLFDLLLRKGCNVTARDNEGANILHVACIGGHVDIVKYILSQKLVDMESRGHRRKTPLMIAVERGHKKIVDLLVSKMCNLKALDADKNNILHIACYAGHLDMVRYILKRNMVDIESKGIAGRTPILIAAETGHRIVVSYLLHKKCNPRAVDDDGNNVLHAACFGGRADMVKYLFKRRFVDEKKKNKIGLTPIQVAESEGHTAIVALLKALSYFSRVYFK